MFKLDEKLTAKIRSKITGEELAFATPTAKYACDDCYMSCGETCTYGCMEGCEDTCYGSAEGSDGDSGW